MSACSTRRTRLGSSSTGSKSSKPQSEQQAAKHAPAVASSEDEDELADQQHAADADLLDSDDCEREDDVMHEASDEDEDRLGSHAQAGPSGAATAAGAGSSRQGRKRSGSVAFRDAISLLPANLDEELLCRTMQQLPERHRMQKHALLAGYRQQFGRWRFMLRQRFSLLFYGFGSKRSLLGAFARESLTDGGVLAVYGHQPGATSKQVLAAVAGALTHRSCKGMSHTELLGLICGEPACRQLYVLLHNIDGPGLRSPDEQLWLSRLATAPAVRLVASIDHVNAALLWDSRTAAAFNWLWLDATSYAAYEAETSRMLPIITSCKQSAAKRGAATVLSSMVQTARDVFKLLASVQQEDAESPGLSFPLLFRMARERFIINQEGHLRSILAEFRDHELIKVRPGADGAEVMFIPMEPEQLAKALQEVEDG